MVYFQTYHSSTVPVVEDFRKAGLLREVEADGPVEEVFRETEKVLNV